jgi:hypothetical protein
VAVHKAIGLQVHDPRVRAVKLYWAVSGGPCVVHGLAGLGGLLTGARVQRPFRSQSTVQTATRPGAFRWHILSTAPVSRSLDPACKLRLF